MYENLITETLKCSNYTEHLILSLLYSSIVSTQIYTELGSSKKLNEYSKAHPLCQIE